MLPTCKLPHDNRYTTIILNKGILSSFLTVLLR